MNENLPLYNDDYFHEQLKKVRLYRGFKTQAVLCKKINVARQVWSLWELNKRKPTIHQLTDIANCLSVDMCYFFIFDACPSDFDLLVEGGGESPPEENGPDVDQHFLLMPFQKTNVSRQIFSALDKCRERRGIYTISVFSDCGNSRALKEYARANPGLVTIFDGYRLPDEELLSSKLSGLLVFDDADKLPEQMLSDSIFDLARGFSGSIVLVGKSIKEFYFRKGIFERIHENFSIDCITSGDFNLIAKAALPEASTIVLNFLRIQTGVRLNSLFDIIKKIDKQKKSKLRFVLNVNSINNLCNQ